MKDREELDLPLDRYLVSEFSETDRDRVWAKICARRPRRLEGRPRPTLPVPISEVLVGQSELTVARARVWRGVMARVKRRPPRQSLVRPALAFATFVSAVAITLLVVKHPEIFRRVEPAQALLRADGEALGPIDASAQAQVVRLADASEIRLARGARLEPLQSSGTRFELLLTRGSAEFSVTPGGPRRWLVEAGVARVEVVGTVFRVERSSDKVVVSVSRGAVLVRGERVPGWVQKVSAGQRVEVEAREGSQATLQPGAEEPPDYGAAAASAAGAAEDGTLPRQETALEPTSEALSRSARSRRAARGRGLPDASDSPAQRYAALGPRGIARETAAATSIETLLQLADIARLSGHPQEAVAPLSRALAAFRNSPQAALAAFTLGRVLLDQLDQPRPAAAAFERAIALRLPRALSPDCYRRLAEAYGRAGDEEARAGASERLRATFGAADTDSAVTQSPGDAAPRARALEEVGRAAP